MKTEGRHRVVLVAGMPIAGYAAGRCDGRSSRDGELDRARAGRSETTWRGVRTIGAHRTEIPASLRGRRPRRAGPGDYPRGRPRLGRARTRLVGRLRAEGKSVRQIADRVGVSEKAIRKQLRRWAGLRESRCRPRSHCPSRPRTKAGRLGGSTRRGRRRARAGCGPKALRIGSVVRRGRRHARAGGGPKAVRISGPRRTARALGRS